MDFFTDLAAVLVRPAELPFPVALVSLFGAFMFGACWGSFLNVVIARVPEGVSVVSPRSRCPKCEKQIDGRDNIPILSWLLLRAKCRNCKAPISWRYPFIELLIGLLATALVARHGWSLEALELFVFALLLVAIAFIDLDTWTVPNPMWITLIATGLGFALFRSWRADEWTAMAERFIGAGASFLFLGAIVVIFTFVLRKSGRLGPDETAMGWGDPLILAGVGAFLGWKLLPLVLFLASLQGAAVGIVLRLRGGLKGGKPVSDDDDWIPPEGALPFGPFLALGALEAAFFGASVLERLGPILDLFRSVSD